MRRLLIGTLAAAGLLAVPLAPAGAGGDSATAYPSSVIVLGNSAATGSGSDPAHPYRAAPGNSWATGTNPAVQSVYSRILAVNPAIRGHNANFANDEASINDLATQVRMALKQKTKPELVLIEIEGDVECDGKDESRVADFRTSFSADLDTLAKELPNARVFVLSSWGSFSSYVAYLKALPTSLRLKHAGKGPCQFVESPSARVVPSHVAYIQKTVTAYEKQLAAACAQVPNCRYDGGAAQRMAVTGADISVDQNHLTIQGQAKLAAVVWGAMSGFVK